jgi:hypothetical protein
VCNSPEQTKQPIQHTKTKDRKKVTENGSMTSPLTENDDLPEDEDGIAVLRVRR